MTTSFSLHALLAAALLGAAGLVMAHGNVTPQEVDTGDLPELGDEVRSENPFREGSEYGNLISLNYCLFLGEISFDFPMSHYYYNSIFYSRTTVDFPIPRT